MPCSLILLFDFGSFCLECWAYGSQSTHTDMRSITLIIVNLSPVLLDSGNIIWQFWFPLTFSWSCTWVPADSCNSEPSAGGRQGVLSLDLCGQPLAIPHPGGVCHSAAPKSGTKVFTSALTMSGCTHCFSGESSSGALCLPRTPTPNFCSLWTVTGSSGLRGIAIT